MIALTWLNPAFNGRLDSWQAACGKARGESESFRNELRELKTENESLRADAERYRWLRVECENHDSMITIAEVSGFGLVGWSGDDPDSMIDAAIGKGEQS